MLGSALDYTKLALVYIAKKMIKWKNTANNKAVILANESKGVTFKIIKVVLLDRSYLRMTLIDTKSGKRYFAYHKGDYTAHYKENKGEEMPCIDQYYFIAAACFDEWTEL